MDLSSLRGICTVGGEGDDEDVAKAGDDELDDDTDGTRWITEQRTTAFSGVGDSSDFFCVDKLMSCGSGRMLVGSLTTTPESSLVFGESHELVMVGGVGGYSLRWACVRMNRWAPLPYGISPPSSDDLKRRGASAASI